MTIALTLIFPRHCSNYLIVLVAVNSLCWRPLKKYVIIASLIPTYRPNESSLILWRWYRNWSDSPQRRVFFWITLKLVWNWLPGHVHPWSYPKSATMHRLSTTSEKNTIWLGEPLAERRGADHLCKRDQNCWHSRWGWFDGTVCSKFSFYYDLIDRI